MARLLLSLARRPDEASKPEGPTMLDVDYRTDADYAKQLREMLRNLLATPVDERPSAPDEWTGPRGRARRERSQRAGRGAKGNAR